jgi:hypothetical protein
VTPKLLKQCNVILMLAEYKDLMNSTKWNAYKAQQQQRGSSADWGDEASEDALPQKEVKMFQLFDSLQ